MNVEDKDIKILKDHILTGKELTDEEFKDSLDWGTNTREDFTHVLAAIGWFAKKYNGSIDMHKDTFNKAMRITLEIKNG